MGAGHWRGVVHTLTHAMAPHSHEVGDKVDSELEASRDGLRALWISLAILVVTAVAQAVVVVLSGSVALLGDTVHNAADALTAVPLGIAFVLGRRRGDPPLHLRVRPRRGPGRDRHRRGHRRLGGVFGVGRRRTGCSTRSRWPTCRWWPPPRCSGSWATRWWRATASGSGAGSGPRRWSPTGCTPAPTGSPRWPSCSGPAAPRWAGGGPTRWSGW